VYAKLPAVDPTRRARATGQALPSAVEADRRRGSNAGPGHDPRAV